MESQTPPQLVRELLLLMLGILSPVLILTGVIGVAMVLGRIRSAVAPAKPAQRPPALRSADAVRVARRMRRNAQTALRLAPAEGSSDSWLGGQPALPRGMPWPHGPEGALRFICQLCLAQVRLGGGPNWLPSDGTILAFHDERHGAADQVRIIYVSADAVLERRAATELAAWPYRASPVSFVAERSLPSLDWLDEAHLNLEDGELDVLADLPSADLPAPRHLVGGYPEEIQNEQMAMACDAATGQEPPNRARAVRTWRMLLQIDSDEAVGSQFGDGGRLYVFVREADARRGHFESTVTISQTY